MKLVREHSLWKRYDLQPPCDMPSYRWSNWNTEEKMGIVVQGSDSPTTKGLKLDLHWY